MFGVEGTGSTGPVGSGGSGTGAVGGGGGGGGGMMQVDLPRGVGPSVGAAGQGGGGQGGLTSPSEVEVLRRNSRQYTDAAADRVLGLSGRSLKRKCSLCFRVGCVDESFSCFVVCGGSK